MGLVKIKRAELADFEQVAALHKAHLLEEGAPSNEVQLSHLKSSCFSDKEARFMVLVAKDKDKIIAYSICSYLYTSLMDDTVLYISDLYVKPGYRQQGVGTKILEYIKATENPSALTWRSLKTNQVANAIYKKSDAVVEFEKY